MNFEKLRRTGELSDITVIVDKTEFKLHTFPLFTKSDYFKKAVEVSTTTAPYVVRLDNNFPGGAQVFNQLADYFYSIPINIDHKNIIALRSAACFIQCSTLGALLDDRFDKILLVARSKYDLGIPLVLLEQCIGEYQEWAKKTYIVNKCLECIVESLARGAGLQLSKSDREIIIHLPLEWIIELIKLCPWDSKLAVLPFAKHYVTVRVLDKNSFNDSSLTSLENGYDYQGDRTSNRNNESTDLTTDDEKRQILDEVVNTLGDMLEQLPLIWLSAAYEKSIRLQCQCEPKLSIYVIQSILNSMDFEKSIENIPDNVIATLFERIIIYKEEHIKDPQLLAKLPLFVNDYIEHRRRRGTLTCQEFIKVAMCIPKEQHYSHDTLLCVLDDILKDEQSTELSACEREELLNKVDFSRINEETIIMCKSNKLIPQQLITEAALNLCIKLRNQLEETQGRLKVFESELARSRASFMNADCRKHVCNSLLSVPNRLLSKFSPSPDLTVASLAYSYLKHNQDGDLEHTLPIRCFLSSSSHRFATCSARRY